MFQNDTARQLDTQANINFLYGKIPTLDLFLQNPKQVLELELGKQLMGSKNKNEFVCCVRLNPAYELLHKIGLFRQSKFSLSSLIKHLEALGYNIGEKKTVFPSFESARFFFPYEDDTSHKFLIKEILSPRSYSLPFILRMVFQVYLMILMVKKDTRFLYRCVSFKVSKE